jgi:hypothetical protein
MKLLNKKNPKINLKNLHHKKINFCMINQKFNRIYRKIRIKLLNNKMISQIMKSRIRIRNPQFKMIKQMKFKK